MDKNTIILDFELSNSKKYKVEKIENSIVYIRELEISYLLKLYYFIFWKDY